MSRSYKKTFVQTITFKKALTPSMLSVAKADVPFQHAGRIWFCFDNTQWYFCRDIQLLMFTYICYRIEYFRTLTFTFYQNNIIVRNTSVKPGQS